MELALFAWSCTSRPILRANLVFRSIVSIDREPMGALGRDVILKGNAFSFENSTWRHVSEP